MSRTTVVIGLGLIWLAGVLAPEARADIVFDSTQGLCCFDVDLHQTASGVLVTVTLAGGATVFANTGNGTNHPGFAFNLDRTITSSNIQNAQNLSTFHVGPDQTNGPDMGIFGYYFDIPGNGASANDAGPLKFDVVLPGLTPLDFMANDAGYFFTADVLNGTTGEVGVNTQGVSINLLDPVPEPASIILLATVLIPALMRLRTRCASNTVRASMGM